MLWYLAGKARREVHLPRDLMILIRWLPFNSWPITRRIAWEGRSILGEVSTGIRGQYNLISLDSPSSRHSYRSGEYE